MNDAVPPSQHQAGDAPRDSGAASWETIYQADDAGWDLGEASPPLCCFVAEKILPSFADASASRVLVPGCGSGHDLLPLAQCGYQVIGADFAPTAVRLAQQRAADAGVQNHVQVLEIDVIGEDLCIADKGATDNNINNNSIDWIFDHTFFCALLPQQRAAYAQAYKRMLKNGGEVWALNMRTKFANRQPYDCSPEDYIQLMQDQGFTCIEQRPLDEESHQRRRPRETLIRLRLS